MAKRFVQYGAGSIGRSFTGALFARAGYEVTFIDVNPAITEALKRDHRYKVEVHDDPPGEFWVEGVRAVDGRDTAAVAAAIAEADMMATSVGMRILPHIYAAITQGLQQRRAAGRPPLDIIIAENIRNGAQVMAEGLQQYLPADFPLASCVGLIETSIGKMAPIMPDEVMRREPTLVYAEAYNTLILDAKGFRNPIPDVAGLAPKQNMAAWVDRKLFVHNLGHATCAYLGHLQRPEMRYVWELMGDAEIRAMTKTAMQESGAALVKRYPDDFNETAIAEHIEDLLRRFANQALGDTVFRLGRDLARKLARDDRLIGALLLDEEMGVAALMTTRATAAALFFHAKDEEGRAFAADEEFHARLQKAGPETMLCEVGGLDQGKPAEARVMQRILWEYERLEKK
jgi:mannitol-1-phosphate 5-dehydrogenase